MGIAWREMIRAAHFQHHHHANITQIPARLRHYLIRHLILDIPFAFERQCVTGNNLSLLGMDIGKKQ